MLRLRMTAPVFALLAACAQGNSTAELGPAAPQPGAQATAPAAPPPKGAVTPEEAKTQCWMKYEGDKKVKTIDQRLSLVEKCVDDTLRGQLVQAPALLARKGRANFAS